MQSYLCEGDVPAARTVLAEAVRRVGPTETAAFFADGVEWLFDAETFALLRRLHRRPSTATKPPGRYVPRRGRAGGRVTSRPLGTTVRKPCRCVEAHVRNAPAVPVLHTVLAHALAFAGRKDEAVREARLATELETVEKSPWFGMELVSALAQTYMLVGEQDEAIATLERILKSPYQVTPAWLKVDPTCDSLRQNPRFQKLVASK